MLAIEPRFNTTGQWAGAMICPMVQYSERLLLAMRKAGHTTASLHRALGVSYQAVKKAVDGGKFGTANHLKAARLLGVNPEWLATGCGEMKAQHDSFAHAVSYLPFDDPVLTREDLMAEKERPARFIYVLDDDAMGKHGKKGDQVVFDRDQIPRVGSGVLVMTGDGDVHVRRMAQGRNAGHWLAIPANTLYRALDSSADGLRILGVWRSNLDKGLEDA